MDVKINMLNVKDGDAIIIELFKNEKSLVIVIDGGEPSYYETMLKPLLLSILKLHKKKAPDIVVCSHYDSDHIGGLILLVNEYISNIKEVWVHKTPELLLGYISKAKLILEDRNKLVPTCLDFYPIQNLFEGYRPKQKSLLDKKAQVILESLPQLKKLIDLIPDDKLKQVFYRDRPLTDWQEVIVLGPTIKFFNQLFPATKSLTDFIKEEAIAILPLGESFHLMKRMEEKNPCDRLKNDTNAKITSTNKASIIIAIDDDKNRYLFTGDAGIESFKAIPNWELELKELYFLKVPHHASNNNISKELIELMQPIYVYNSGFKHQDDDVLDCFKRKSRNKEVKTTKTDGNLLFPC
jgi:beta-lactamase superfamily II metal-dependent hydrolase